MTLNGIAAATTRASVSAISIQPTRVMASLQNFSGRIRA
jgi:hypothetical protein